MDRFKRFTIVSPTLVDLQNEIKNFKKEVEHLKQRDLELELN